MRIIEMKQKSKHPKFPGQFYMPDPDMPPKANKKKEHNKIKRQAERTA